MKKLLSNRIIVNNKVKVIILFSGFQGLINSMLRYLMPIALIFYGWNLGSYALVYFFQAISMLLPFIFGGLLSDLKGRRETIIIGLIVFIMGITTLAFYISSDKLIMIIIGQMLATLSNGTIQIGISTILVDETNEGQERTSNFGKSQGLRNLLGLFGPMLLGIMISGTNIFGLSVKFNFSIFNQSVYVSSFILLSFMALGGVIFSFILPTTSKKFIEENKQAKISDFTEEQKSMQKSFLKEEILIGILSGAIVPYINYYVLTVFQPSDFVWSVIFGISNASIAVGNYLVGQYSEHFGKGKTIVILNLFAPVFAFGIAISPNLLWVSIFYIIRTTLANAVQPAWQSWYFAHTLKTARGRAYSVIQISRRMARAVGIGIGPAVFGFLGAFSFPIISLFYPVAMLIPLKNERKLGLNN